ncbi:MAG: ABC transporter permease [Planctomycetota bacterium]|jgi:ABC-type transport system involved in multi-copper enzyme maturation permease subunit
MKVALVSLLLLIVILPVLGFSATGDETLKGRLQTFVSYSLSLMSFLLCVLTIIVSVYTVTSDIEQRQIYTVITKPIRRYQLLVGKLVGVIILDVMLLVLFSAVIYTITIYTPSFTNASEAELVQAEKEFFTARAALNVPEEDVTEEVLARYEELERRSELPPDETREDIIAELTKRKQLAKRAAEVGRALIWEFDNVKPLAETMFIRFKYDIFPNPPDSQVYSLWLAGDDQYIKYGEQPDTPIYEQSHKHAARTFHEVEFPAEVVPEDGKLAIAFVNIPPNEAPVIFPLDGFEVLYKADSFGANFVRSVLSILLRLIFLACLGLMAATFLSFPVAVLFCFVFFFTATFSGFVTESFGYLSENVGAVYSYTLQRVIQLLPQFDKFNPGKFLVPARLLSWSELARAAVLPPWWGFDGDMVFVKAGLLLLLGLLIFRFREIARITV